MAATFRYTDNEIAAIKTAVDRHPSFPMKYWPSIQFLEQRAQSYLYHVQSAASAASRKVIEKEKAERDRIVKRVRCAVPVSERAERVMAVVDQVADEPGSPLPTWLLAQAMFEGEITCADLEALIVREYLSAPGRLRWRGAERWHFADDRKKSHRWEYINELVCFWAEERDCRPDEVSVSPKESATGTRLMDFLFAATSRPLELAGEEIGADRIMDIVQEVREYWRGRSWGDPELEAVLAEETERERRSELDDTVPE